MKRDDDVVRVWKYIHKEEGAEHRGPYLGPMQVKAQKMSSNSAWHMVRDVSQVLIIAPSDKLMTLLGKVF